MYIEKQQLTIIRFSQQEIICNEWTRCIINTGDEKLLENGNELLPKAITGGYGVTNIKLYFFTLLTTLCMFTFDNDTLSWINPC